MYSYQEALEESVKYFDGDELAAKVFVDKYALHDNDDNLLEKTPTDMHWRLAKEFARVEKQKFKNPLSEEEIFNLLDQFKYIVPQGSPMYGIGNTYKYISISNCTLAEPPEDSYGSILHTDQQLVQLSKRRCGVGIDVSKLRPLDAPVQNSAKTSTGITSFMERFSNSIREVGQKNRRGALMITCDVTHPEIENFINIKNDDTKVTGANISVKLTDKFLKAVKENTEFTQQWPIDSNTPKITKVIKAVDLWKKIIHSAWNRAEPGLLFWDTVKKESIGTCYANQNFLDNGTNPCSEIPLPPLDSCRLLALNLLSYVEHPFTDKAKFNYTLFTEHSKIAQRLMDDIVDLEAESINKIIGKIKNDPEENNIKIVELTMWKKMLSMCLQGRRTGTGITALGDTLAALGIPYCSDRGIKTTEKIYKTLKLACYRSSVDMAKEIGAFPIWDHHQEKDNPFLLRIKKDDGELYEDMIRYGRRNIALLTTAPTGTVSLLTQTTSGIEPAFMLSYTRRRKINAGDKNVTVNFVDKSGDTWEEYKVYHHTLKKWMKITGETDETKSPWYGSCAEDLNWKDRVKLQAAAAVHIDHSISSTLNLPENVTEEQVAEIYETAWETGVIKGITVYRKNCRTGVLVDNKQEEKLNLIKTQATKRPKRLTCDVHHLTVKGVRYFTIVGLLDNEPYEIFINRNCNSEGDSVVSRNITSGYLDKQKQGHYNLVDKDDNLVVDIVSANCEEHEEAIARMTSTALRHGADIHFIVHQLEKTRGDMQSFSKAMARTLKKYIKDGTKVTGEKCPECSSDNIVRIEGCKTCVGCGWSKCS